MEKMDRKEENISLIDNLINGLKIIKEKPEKFNISFIAEPQIQEYTNSKGEGVRHIKYVRTIVISDADTTVEKIERIIW